MDYIAADESEYAAVAICLYSLSQGWPTVWKDTTYLNLLKGCLPTDGIVSQAMVDEGIKTDGELMAICLMATMVIGLTDSMRYVKKAVAGDSLAGWWSNAMVNAVRDLLPYLIYLLAMVKWASVLSDKLEGTTQVLFIIGNSACFSRMCLELVHDIANEDRHVPSRRQERSRPLFKRLAAVLAGTC